MKRGLFYLICAIIMLCMAVVTAQILRDPLDPIVVIDYGRRFSAPISAETVSHDLRPNQNPSPSDIPISSPDPDAAQAQTQTAGTYNSAPLGQVVPAQTHPEILDVQNAVPMPSNSQGADLAEPSYAQMQSAGPQSDGTFAPSFDPRFSAGDSRPMGNPATPTDLTTAQPSPDTAEETQAGSSASEQTDVPPEKPANSFSWPSSETADGVSTNSPDIATGASSQADVQNNGPESDGAIVTKTSLPAAAGKRVITSATLTLADEFVSLRLEGNAPLRARTFTVSNPDRVVLDLQGIWEFSGPAVKDNRMLSGMRIGRQENAIRLVFDMLVKPNESTVRQTSDTVVELRIR